MYCAVGQMVGIWFIYSRKRCGFFFGYYVGRSNWRDRLLQNACGIDY